jgi:hypothetical protein
MKAGFLFVAAAAVALPGGACAPDLGVRDSLVDGVRVLAVVSEPAEAKPGATVAYRALVVGPDGTHASTPADAWAWATCTAPKLLEQENSVDDACTEGAVRPIGSGPTASAPVPTDACSLFGPDAPPGLRPRDPDPTGGYYVPVRLRVPPTGPSDGTGLTAFGFTRATCDLAGAPSDAALAYTAGYQANQNPHLDGVDVPGPVAPGAKVTLRARWPAGSAESYLAYDSAARALTTRGETLRVAWFATGGAFDADATGNDATGLDATGSASGWTAPEAPGLVHAWVVLRDTRGGADFFAFDLTVAP